MLGCAAAATAGRAGTRTRQDFHAAARRSARLAHPDLVSVGCCVACPPQRVSLVSLERSLTYDGALRHLANRQGYTGYKDTTFSRAHAQKVCRRLCSCGSTGRLALPARWLQHPPKECTLHRLATAQEIAPLASLKGCIPCIPCIPDSRDTPFMRGCPKAPSANCRIHGIRGIQRGSYVPRRTQR